jgi:choline-glycine betaine transporter
MVYNNKHTPEKMVGRTANLTIFLGILYTSLSIVAVSGVTSLSTRGYGIQCILIGCTIVGLGYGIRYGSKAYLYMATVLFGMLAAYFMYNFLINKSINSIVRFAFSVWAVSTLTRAISVMAGLKANGASPDRSSRYKDFFLRRTQHK